MTNSQQNQSLTDHIRSNQTVWAAGAYDALSAIVIERSGFPAVMTTGFGISAAHLGQPDMELYTMSENLDVVRKICNVVGIPVIADADTGYGNAINVMRTVREFERAGVTAMIFEDQVSPKRCPAAANVIEILPTEEAAAKIRAAVAARENPDTVIIARTDALDESEAIERAKAYVEAGADLIQPISKCFSNFDGLATLRNEAGVPLSLQILGWLETDLEPSQIEEVAGLAVFPLVALMSTTAALKQNLSQLASDHSTRNLPGGAASMSDVKNLVGWQELEALQDRYLSKRD